MTLPKLITPEFSMEIPSTKQEIKYRPFLVKEEKVLYIALEGGDPKEIENAILNILEVCILTPDVEIRKLPSYDIEYLFINLRGKSVSEIVNMSVNHAEYKECKHTTDIQFDVNEVKVEFNENHINKINIVDKIGIQFKDPSLSDLVSKEINLNDTENYDSVLNIVANCIDVVYDEEDVYTNFTKKEIVDFLGELTQPQFLKIQEFFDTMPKLKKELNWTCEKCGENDKVVIEGLQNFFM